MPLGDSEMAADALWWLEWARCSTPRASVSAGGALDARIRDSQPAYAFWLDQADRKRNDSGPPAAKQKPTAACQQAIGSVGIPRPGLTSRNGEDNHVVDAGDLSQRWLA